MVFRANSRVEFLGPQLSDVVLFDLCISRFGLSRFRDMNLNLPILEDQDLFRLLCLFSRIVAEGADNAKFPVKQEEILLLVWCNGSYQFFVIYLILIKNTLPVN